MFENLNHTFRKFSTSSDKKNISVIFIDTECRKSHKISKPPPWSTTYFWDSWKKCISMAIVVEDIVLKKIEFEIGCLLLFFHVKIGTQHWQWPCTRLYTGSPSYMIKNIDFLKGGREKYMGWFGTKRQNTESVQ